MARHPEVPPRHAASGALVLPSSAWIPVVRRIGMKNLKSAKPIQNADVAPEQSHLCPPLDLPLVFSKAPLRLRLPRPLILSQTKISAFERLFTSSTLSHHHLLRSPKERKLSLFDFIHNQDSRFSSHNQLPHRTSCAVLPLTEEESTKSRQTAQGPACYRHRPP